jgi:hypothetical protein
MLSLLLISFIDVYFLLRTCAVISSAVWAVFIYADTTLTYPPTNGSPNSQVQYQVPSYTWYIAHIILRSVSLALSILFFLPLVILFRKHLIVQEVIMTTCMTMFTVMSNFLSAIEFLPKAEGFPEGKVCV